MKGGSREWGAAAATKTPSAGMNYVVTAHPADAVSHALVSNFISEDELDLIVSKGSRLVIYSAGPEGLQPFKEVPMYGRIATMELWRPPGQKLAQLFVSTESNKFCILAWDGSEIVTKANGDLSDRIGRPADSGPIAIMEPRCRLIGLHLYDGLFKVIPATPSGALDKEAFNIRLEELQVIDLVFLHGLPKPTLALLYEDNKEARHLKTYEVHVKEKDFADGPWPVTNTERNASILIPVREPPSSHPLPCHLPVARQKELLPCLITPYPGPIRR